MTTTERPTPHQAVLELQARARDHALIDRVDHLERTVARVHARIDGALVTIVPKSFGANTTPQAGPQPAP